MIPALAALAIALSPVTDKFADTDHDGLLDQWETQGFGPLDPKIHGCNPKHADFIVCFRLRQGMTPATIQPTIDRMKKFYAGLNHMNPDGTIGLNLIPVILDPIGKEFDGKGYIELYNEAFPSEWHGLSHGILVENSGGGGGQANRPDWAGTGYNWWTMIHELGHQLGLPHEPVGASIGSPFHASLMNYDYLYQFDNDAEKVQFSSGKFLKLKMKETDLDENLPFSVEDLDFLAKRPHYFTIKAVDKTHAMIDWNRNGVLGEKHVRANVNDGYSVDLRQVIKGEVSAGAPWLAGLKNELWLVMPESKAADLAKPDKDHSAGISASVVRGDKVVDKQPLVPEGVTGDISVFSSGNKLTVAYPTASSWSVDQFELTKGRFVRKLHIDTDSDPVEPTLVQTPHGLCVILRRVSDGELTIQPIDQSWKPVDLGIKSQYAVGAAWNSKRRLLAIAGSEDKDKQAGFVKLSHFRFADGTWTAGDSDWVGGARTSGPLKVIYDAGKDRGPMGAYNVYCKGYYGDANQPGLNYMCRQIAAGSGWWIKMMGNEWANSRSVCAVVPYKGDIAYAYRWYGGPEDNRVWITPRASGIDNDYLTDFDEVSFIFEHGLQDSLRWVRDEQWKVKK